MAAGSQTIFTSAQIADLIAADVKLWSRLNLPMVEWAQRLQHAGIRTGILSNIGDAMADGLIAKFDWISAFDHCVWSYSLKLAKPEAAIYHYAAEGLATDPAHILFIDDKQENIEAGALHRHAGHSVRQPRRLRTEMHQRGLAALLHPLT